MNWIMIGIPLLFSFTTLILASQLIAKRSQHRTVRKPIPVKIERAYRKRR
jgi:hypothetical protein